MFVTILLIIIGRGHQEDRRGAAGDGRPRGRDQDPRAGLRADDQVGERVVAEQEQDEAAGGGAEAGRGAPQERQHAARVAVGRRDEAQVLRAAAGGRGGGSEADRGMQLNSANG